MVCYMVGAMMKETLEEAEPLFKEMVGLIDIVKAEDNRWVLCFEDEESAIASKWQMEALREAGKI